MQTNNPNALTRQNYTTECDYLIGPRDKGVLFSSGLGTIILSEDSSTLSRFGIEKKYIRKVFSLLQVLIAAGFISCGGSPAWAGKGLESINLAGARPAGMYTLVSEFVPSACRSVLASLNKPYSLANIDSDNYPRVALQSDLLLNSDLQLSWTRKLVRQPEGRLFKRGSLDFAPIKDGDRSFLYRRSFELSGPALSGLPVESLAVNSLRISSRELKMSPGERILNSQVLARVGGKRIYVDMKRLKQSSASVNAGYASQAGSPESRRVLLNVVDFDGKSWILAADAYDADVESAQSGSYVDVFMLRLILASNLKSVCHFRGH